jgi:hypothetical protein
MTDPTMLSPEQQIGQLERTLKAPRSAAFAGIAFALLYGAGLILLTLSVPPYTASGATDTAWLKTHEETLKLALFLMPYAGIAFLWFIGVLRDQLGTAELGAQRRDVDVEGPRRTDPGGVPDPLHQRLTRDRVALGLHQHAEQLELLAGQRDELLTDVRLPRPVVEPDVAELADQLDRLLAEPAHHRVDPGHQLGGAVWLRDVVVDARAECRDDGRLLAPGGHRDDRHLARVTHLPAERETVLVGQSHVEEHQVDVTVLLHRLCGCRHAGHPQVRPLECRKQRRDHAVVVLHEKNAHPHSPSLAAGTPEPQASVKSP